MPLRPFYYFQAALAAASAALALALAPNANASIVGSTYDFTTSESGNTVITPLGGPTAHTDPANPGFCVGSTSTAPDCASGPGLSGSFAFAKLSPTVDTITFTFFGSTVLAGPGTFDVDLGHFTTLDGEFVKAVSHVSGELAEGDFSNVTFNGTDAVFTGRTSIDYNAVGGTSVVFGVVTSTVPTPTVPTPTVPEPDSVALLGSALAGFGLILRRRGQV